jgi:hypothetical protein
LNTNDVDWYALQDNYQDSSTLTQKLVAGMQEKAQSGKLDRMNNLDCISAYAQLAQSTYGTLLLIINDTNSTWNSGPVHRVYISDRLSSVYDISPSTDDVASESAFNESSNSVSAASGILALFGTAPDPYGWICGGKNTTLPDPDKFPPDYGVLVGAANSIG